MAWPVGSTAAYSAHVSPLVFRTWMPEDVPFLWEMLYQSLHVREGSVPWPRSVLRSPAIAHYLTDFGSHDGDDAQVCLDGGGERVGAAWVRRMTAADPGYGYVNDEVPELGMAIQENWRGRGIGRRLLETARQTPSHEPQRRRREPRRRRVSTVRSVSFQSNQSGGR